MTGAGASERKRFRAFISYSHKDAAFANRLHRRLEGYVLPKHLGAGRRLTPIFKDREELPAAHDLSAQVRAALEASDCLIVVCSPDATASPWVGREIETFRRLHPDWPVLAALVRGEPADAFPAALLTDGAEPLAADFRRQADGDRLAFLKLAAGMAGVGVDRLVQRDAQRRLQRVMVVTAASVVAMIAMAAMTTYALAARAEADRQRAEAEGLISFMATDLMERLEGVGRLDIMGAVNQRALAYYGRQDLARLPATSLQQRAELLQSIGSFHFKRAEYELARGQFAEARRVTSALLAAEPDNPERIKAHGVSDYWVGYVDWKQGRTEAALAAFERYAAATRRLLDIDPTNPDWRMEAGYAQSNLGTIALRDLAEPRRARPHFEAALAHFEAAARARPTDAGVQRDRADAYGWLADCLRDLNEFSNALDLRRKEAAIAASLRASDPKNVRYARDLLGVNLSLGQLEMAVGDAAAGRRLLAETYVLARTLAAADPQNQELAQQRVAIGLTLVGVIWADPSATAAARTHADSVMRECDTAAARDPELRALCMVLRQRRAKSRGSRDIEAEAYLRSAGPRLATTRRSPRWGINFAAELKTLDPTKTERPGI